MNSSVHYMSDKEMEIIIGGTWMGNSWKMGWHFWEPRPHLPMPHVPVKPPMHIW